MCVCSGTPVKRWPRLLEAISFIMNALRFGMERANSKDMKNIYLFTLLVLLLWPAFLSAGDQAPKVKFCECVIEEIMVADQGDVKISQTLRDEARALVGQKYSTELTDAYAAKIRRELKDHNVDITIDVNPYPDEKHCHIKLRIHYQAVPKANINERYVVEAVVFAGEGESKVSQNLRNEGQKMVDNKFSEEFSNNLADRLRSELKGYSVAVKVERGAKPDHVKVVFRVDKTPGKKRGISIGLSAPFVYHSQQAFSIKPQIKYQLRSNAFTFGIVSDADELLERNAGLYAGYERHKLGTELMRFRIDFESYHQKFNPATESALAARPDIPGIYRARQNLEPSLSFHFVPDLSIKTGVSFQRLQIQYPGIHTLTAYAGIADVEYHKTLLSKAGYEHDFRGSYKLRTATGILESDFVYTRQAVAADYILRKGRNFLEARFSGGSISGTAPLFERFSLGNCGTLRGWNKFDVAPLGGMRAAHGSLEYRYGQFRLFYDVGTVWDPGRHSKIRHGLGFGWAHKNLFASVAFPIRLQHVVPVFMMGMRLGAR